MPINVQLVYGAGDDDKYGTGLRILRTKIIEKFNDKVNIPRIIDHREYSTLLKLLKRWETPTILIGHSCGVETIAKAAVDLSLEPIPYLMGIAPSIYCKPLPLPPNVARATQVYPSFDFFNPFRKQLVLKSGVNDVTVIDMVNSSKGHVDSAEDPIVHEKALFEIENALSTKDAIA